MYNDGLHSDNFILLGFVKINIISYWKEIWNGFDDGEAICSIDVYPFLAFSTWKRILYLLFSYHHGCKHYFLLHVHCERYPGITGYILHPYVSLDVCIFLHDVVMKVRYQYIIFYLDWYDKYYSLILCKISIYFHYYIKATPSIAIDKSAQFFI